MWTDGTDLSGHTMPRTGYYGRKGDNFESQEPDGVMALACVRAVRLSGGNKEIWSVLRHFLKAHDIGDIGSSPDAETVLEMENEQNDPNMLIAVLELYRTTDNPDFLALAERIGNNIISSRNHYGYFLPTSEHVYARFDSLEPLALLTLEAFRRGIPEAVPPYLSSFGSTQGAHDDHDRTIRDWIFYEEIR